VVAAYRLQLMRGLTLVGPPGTGKTMLAGAVAGYLSETRPDTRFLHVKPGALRGMYYGETEARIRELFTVARRAPGLVVIFFDELDTFGARGSGIGHEIDDRVMGALLAEIDGLEPSDDILCIGATNRLDLCDDALVRQGRLADRIYHVQRPGREAARQIFARYLPPDLPYAADGEASTGAMAVIDAAVGFLFAPRGGAGPIATVTLADSTRDEITAPAVISGALIASAVERAKHVAAARHADGSGGLAVEDVLAALDQALSAEADKIRSPAAARRTLDFPGAADIVHVDIPANRRPRRYRYLRAA
jgi:proteasome-associated ATPase